MSMLSAQCDELRAMAESVGLAMPQAATLMMEAADTIWELRDRAQALQAENVNLREELEAVGMAAYSYGRGDLKAENDRLRERITTQKQTIQAYRDESREWREVADHAQAENAKLRELVRDMYKAFMHGNCYRWCEFKEPCNYISDGRCQWYDRMTQLGVEVNA